MQINHCLILAAGFGTRMGSIGQKLPKVLWPVFEKTLLELQVAYARSLGIQNICINLHYMGEEIYNFCRNRSAFEGVKFLWEKPDILDIGGAIHNLASLPEIKYKGKLLVLNGDQFFYLTRNDFERFVAPHSKSPCLLFTYQVNSSQGYNALELSPERLIKKIIPNKEIERNQVIETYTGISIIDLSKLEQVSGKSAFFDSVCPFIKKEVPTILLENIDYWDFGTINRYWETCQRILSTYRTKSTHPFLRFLVQEKALKTWKIDLQNISYHARSKGVINLNQEVVVQDLNPTIILDDVAKKMDTPTIWWRGIFEEIRLS